MNLFFAIAILLFSSCAVAQQAADGHFSTHIDGQVLNFASPQAPSEQFLTHKDIFSLRDDALFQKTGRYVATQAHWKFRDGVTRQVLGAMEMKIIVTRVQDQQSMSLDAVKTHLQATFNNELKKFGYAGAPVPFDILEINGREWLAYRAPVIGRVSYSTALRNEGYVTVGFNSYDNTGGSLNQWHHDADRLAKMIIHSATLHVDQ